MLHPNLQLTPPSHSPVAARAQRSKRLYHRTHLLVTSAVAIIIVSMLVLLFELQYPFRSNIGIGADACT